jgi:hypothetical protein
VHRQVPQVGGVGDGAQHDQRSQQRSSGAGGGPGQQHQQPAAHGDQRQRDQVGPRVGTLGGQHRPGEQRQHQAGADQHPGPGTDRDRGHAAFVQHPEPAPDQQCAGPGRGQGVDPRDVRGLGQQGQGAGEQGHRDADAEHPVHRATPPGEAEQQRPEQVELLLGRQSPQVVHRARTVRDERQVHRVGQPAGQGGDDQPATLAVVRDPLDHRVPDQHEQQGGQQTPCPCGEEPPVVHPPAGLQLGQQQAGDQETGQGEEQGDPEHPGGAEPGRIGVVEQHQRDGETAQGIESRAAAVRRRSNSHAT